MKQSEYVINGQRFVVEILSLEGGKAKVRVNETTYQVDLPSETQAGTQSSFSVTPSSVVPTPEPSPSLSGGVAPSRSPSSAPATPEAAASGTVVSAPMPGAVLSLKVSEGDVVSAGDALLILEAMKMENEVSAPRGGTVRKLFVSEGNQVSVGDGLVELE